jgi:RNA polymerase sigma-70 factor (ECF subfamily)
LAATLDAVTRNPGSSDRSVRFELLFRRDYSAVAAYVARRASPDAVEDLVDEVFLVAWRRLEVVPEDPLPWLLTVARNVLGTHIRAARRGRALRLRLATEYVDAITPSGRTDEVAAALAALHPRDREVLMLIGWEGLTPTQAARVLGQSPATFRVRLHRARGRFRKLLDVDAAERSTELDDLSLVTEVSNV